MGTGDCKYEVWKSAVNDLQKRRDILFCSCGYCTVARRNHHMHTVDERPKVKERMLVLASTTKPANDDEKVDVN